MPDTIPSFTIQDVLDGCRGRGATNQDVQAVVMKLIGQHYATRAVALPSRLSGDVDAQDGFDHPGCGG